MMLRIIAGVLLVLAWGDHAYAYLDPGSGSMLVQLVLGGVAGVVVAVKLYWRRALTRFGLQPKEPPEQPAE